MLIINSVISVLCPVLAMVMFTVLERKLIGYIQIRRGPSKVGFIGAFQPILDALKLLSKEMMLFEKSNVSIFLVCPMMGLCLSLMLWGIYPGGSWGLPVSLVAVMAISSLSVYSVIGSSWSSNSKYASLGSMRGVAQTISYEVSMSLILISGACQFGSWDIELMSSFSVCVFSPLIIFWLVTCLAETNRAPFDFVEGESELVSGFNVDYGSLGFVMIFMAEYLTMLFLSWLTYCVFIPHILWSGGCTVLFCFCFVWVRSLMPRMRFDLLMSLCWKAILPVTLCWLLASFSLFLCL